MTSRFITRWAKESECRGGTLNKQADVFIIYSGVATTAITGIPLQDGSEVVVWADGVDLSPLVDGVQTTYTVTNGAITLNTSVTNAVIGLGYRGRWKSTKLGAAVSAGSTPLNQTKRIAKLGAVARWLHSKGLRYGPDFDNLSDLPQLEAGKAIATDTIRTAYDEPTFEFRGTWDTDLRLCLEAVAPRPVTLLSATATIETD